MPEGKVSRYKAYPAYKPSGVEWLGDIPAGWEVWTIKQVAELNPSKSEVSQIPDYTHVTFLPMEAIGERGELDTNRLKKISDVRAGYTYIGEGDVCIAKITPCFENGKAAIVDGLENGIAFATTEVIPLRCGRRVDPIFLYSLLTSSPFNKMAEGSMYGAGGQKRVSDSFVANYHFSLPPLPEQTQIAAFLGFETARIDGLIAKQQRLIELLEEKRQAVISHAVTKGLNPQAPLRPSGIDWLGDVPAHWETKRLNLLVNTRKGIAFKAVDFCDHGVRVAKASDIKNLTFNISEVFLPQKFVGIYPKAILREGNIVLSTVGTKLAIVTYPLGQNIKQSLLYRHFGQLIVFSIRRVATHPIAP